MARRLTKEQLISNVYYDIEEGFGSKQATLAKARKEDPTKTKEDVDKFVRQHPNKQVKTYVGLIQTPHHLLDLSIRLT